MKIDTKYYEIDGLRIEWGKPFNDVRLLLDKFEMFKPYIGWPNIRGKCTSIFGLSTTEFEIRSPLEDRPVLQVQYEVSPIKAGRLDSYHTPYLKQLEKHLGKPLKTNRQYKHPYLKKEFISSAVVFNAKWVFDDIRISLSVYGGIRNQDSGKCAAGIFIDWTDEIKAAGPYRQNNEIFENLLNRYLNKDTYIQKFKLKIKQRPFKVVNHELPNPYIAEKDNELRAAQLALYTRELFFTPDAIRSKLTDDEIGYFRVPELNKIFVSNKWDTVYLIPGDDYSLTYWEILPARGYGGRELDIRNLNIEDTRDSNVLFDLIKQIEIDTGQTIKRREKYDD